MDENSSSSSFRETTRQITVTVRPQFIPDRSDPQDGVYVFAYSVIVENHSAVTVQLINRHWRVYSGERQFADVKGEGVIGEQPLLEPGVSFEYTSWTMIDEPSGLMRGIYTFRSATGEFFDVMIPDFYLSCLVPEMLH